MSLLDRSRDLAMQRLAVRRRPDTGELARAAGWGAASAFAGALLCLVPVVLGWIADDRSTTEWYSTLGIGSSFWALAHRAHLWVSGDATRVVFAPLLVTALAVLLARVGARGALGRQTDEAQDPWWLRPVAFVAGYALAGVLIDVIAASGPAGPSWWSVWPGLLGVPAVAMAWALARHREWAVARQVAAQLRERVPVTWLRAIRPGLLGAGLLALAGLVLVAVLGIAHAGRIGHIAGQLDASGPAAVALWAGQAAALPNLAMYAAAWLTGGGVTFGTVQVDAASVHTGVLPMVPVLGGIPDRIGTWAAAAPLVPVLVGAFVGWRAQAGLSRLTALRTKLEHAAAAAAVSILILLLGMWVASAGVGDRALSYVGAQPLVALLLPLELLLPALLAAALAHVLRSRRVGPRTAGD